MPPEAREAITKQEALAEFDALTEIRTEVSAKISELRGQMEGLGLHIDAIDRRKDELRLIVARMG